MLLKTVLGNLECKIFFATQPWWTTFKTSFLGFFVSKTHAYHFNTFFTSVAATLNEKIVKFRKTFSHESFPSIFPN